MPHPRRRNAPPPLPFSGKLALRQWLLGLFGVERFDRLAEHLREESLEGLDEDNVHRFHHALCLHLPEERRPGPAGRGAAGARSGDRRRHRPPERAPHRPGRAPDRLEVLPVPRAALHRDLSRPLVSRPADAARGVERARRRVQRGQGGGRPGLPVRRGRYRDRGFGAAQQAGVLDGHRQRQDAAHARPHPPVSAPARAPRPRPRPQPHPPAHAERRALAPAPARARDGGDRGGDSSTSRAGDRAAGGSSPGGRSRSWRSPSSGTRWGTGPSPWRRSRGTTSC